MTHDFRATATCFRGASGIPFRQASLTVKAPTRNLVEPSNASIRLKPQNGLMGVGQRRINCENPSDRNPDTVSVAHYTHSRQFARRQSMLETIEIKPPRPTRKPQEAPKDLTEASSKPCSRPSRAPRDRAVFQLAYHCGLRDPSFPESKVSSWSGGRGQGRAHCRAVNRLT
jgi:hypothetical protein